MLLWDVFGGAVADGAQPLVDRLWRHPAVRLELRELVGVLDDRTQHLVTPLGAGIGAPLSVHARYSVRAALAGLGVPPLGSGASARACCGTSRRMSTPSS
jgi:hypothetical protein